MPGDRHPLSVPCLQGSIAEVALADLPEVGRALSTAVVKAGFRPTNVVSIERGGRLLAEEVAGQLACPVTSVWATRPGGSLKALLARVVQCLPSGGRDRLRRVEQRWFWRGHMAPRQTATRSDPLPPSARVLVVDDACDSGSSVEGVVLLLTSWGVERSSIRVAVVAATTPLARDHVDFWLIDGPVRFPWSSDSRERGRWLALYHSLNPA